MSRLKIPREDPTDFLAVVPPDPAVYLEELRKVRDPNELGWPAMLPMELALKANTPKEICEAYGIDKEMFASICANPVFIKAYAAAVEALKIGGMSFKVKAQMAAEEFLKTSFEMVKNKNTSDSVRADLIKSTVRWAGWDAKAAEVGQGSNFAIQINLG
jgi:hypothetical protein